MKNNNGRKEPEAIHINVSHSIKELGREQEVKL